MPDAAVARAGQAPGERYRQGVRRGEWIDDPAQHAALAELDRLHQALGTPTRTPGLLARLGRLFAGTPSAPAGLYLWGRVGRGKTFLMDLFAEGLPPGLVLRRHHHRFMREVHERLRALDQRSDPLEEVAEDIARRARVLCLDECMVQDIGDAMILGGLLRGLFARGVVLVTTSNSEPGGLYAEGLQRARFLPAIELLRSHCHVRELASGHDWRLRALDQAPIYQHPPGPEAGRALERIFGQYARGELAVGGVLTVNDRPIRMLRRAANIAWFEFDALCDGPRGNDDYIELARRYPAIIVANVPCFGPHNHDPAKRFIHLVDEFYDRRVKLVLSAAAPIIDLYEGDRLRAEFARTESRLIEMQSREYLELDHRPD